MPLQQILPTWLALNNANFPTASGLTDLRTGQDFPAGGLGLGDYFDMTEKEANSVSYAANGLLHHGRYRLVHVDSGATAANVKTGTIGYLRAGTFVQGVAVVTQPSGATPGNYMVSATPGSGGGSGAVIQVTVTAANNMVASVAQGGYNYVSPPTFNLAGVAGIGSGTVAAQLNSTPNEVTSADQASATTPKTMVNPVVFLNAITPGNYGFVQELGLATVLSATALTANNFVTSVPATGLATDGGANMTNTTVGQSIDGTTGTLPTLSKIYIYGPVCQD